MKGAVNVQSRLLVGAGLPHIQLSLPCYLKLSNSLDGSDS